MPACQDVPEPLVSMTVRRRQVSQEPVSGLGLGAGVRQPWEVLSSLDALWTDRPTGAASPWSSWALLGALGGVALGLAGQAKLVALPDEFALVVALPSCPTVMTDSSRSPAG